jgi:hypothetical protein
MQEVGMDRFLFPEVDLSLVMVPCLCVPSLDSSRDLHRMEMEINFDLGRSCVTELAEVG